MLVFPFPITDQVNRKWKKPPATALGYLQRWQNDQYSSVINTRDPMSRTCLARHNRTAETMANENQDKLQSNVTYVHTGVQTFERAAAQLTVFLGFCTA